MWKFFYEGSYLNSAQPNDLFWTRRLLVAGGQWLFPKISIFTKVFLLVVEHWGRSLKKQENVGISGT